MPFQRPAIPTQRLLKAALATSNATGAATFNLPAPPTGLVWEGTLLIVSAPTGAAFAVTVGGTSWGAWQGQSTGGPIQAMPGEQVQVTATGLTATTAYECLLIGRSDDVTKRDPQYPSNNSSPGSVSVTGGTTAPVTGQQTSNTSQVQLSTNATLPPNALLITALPTNASPGLYFGATGVLTTTGALLQPGATMPCTCPPNAVYIIGANNTDKVTWEIL